MCVCLCVRVNCGNDSSSVRRQEATSVATVVTALHCISDPPLPSLLLLLPGLLPAAATVTPPHCTHYTCLPHPSTPFSLPFSSHCSAATTSRRWWACLSPLTLAAESPGRRDIENKYLKGGGTQLSQMCRNRHSIPPSEANVSKARGLLFVFSSEALWVVY